MGRRRTDRAPLDAIEVRSPGTRLPGRHSTTTESARLAIERGFAQGLAFFAVQQRSRLLPSIRAPGLRRRSRGHARSLVNPADPALRPRSLREIARSLLRCAAISAGTVSRYLDERELRLGVDLHQASVDTDDDQVNGPTRYAQACGVTSLRKPTTKSRVHNGEHERTSTMADLTR